MPNLTTSAERVRLYLAQASAAEAAAQRSADFATAQAFRKVAREWRAIARHEERNALG